ncbi:MAG: IMS domain-containing protein [Prochlorococcaceae cyanobacterium]
MELPIDHFRLLGVSPASDAQAALQMLQQKLDRVPDDGYSQETLDARAELLRSSADLLSDSARRSRYEADLTALAGGGGDVIAALDITSSLEVGGLLLLLEAGQPLDCFELASRNLQPPRAPALGSSREADLALVAARAALAGANELQQQRRYEAAAQLLLQAQQLLQRMGQLPQLRQQLSETLESLSPYRVLDLLSRPLTATAERSEGLRLLSELVERRGGLEGAADHRLGQEEFRSFFKQIRSFLTVQEQVDLFSGWSKTSATADFLATTALTASGFAQRKPERIAAALGRLQASDQSGTAVLQASLQLLLGKVDLAQQSFSSGASPELLSWAQQQADDPLAQLCAYCSDWLQRDVLPGYRDLEADPDLDAYFADRDVQAYIEQHDPKPPQAPSAPTNPFASLATGLGLHNPLQSPPAEALLSDEELEAEALGSDDQGLGELDDDDLEPWAPPWATWSLPTLDFDRLRQPRLIATAAVAAGLVVIVAALVVRGSKRQVTPVPVQPAVQQPTPAPAAKTPAAPASPVPLQVATPSDADLQTLLEAWLAAKAAVLAGRDSSLPLAELARSEQVQRLEAERRSDAARGQTQKVETRIETFEIIERSPTRIAARVSLNYSDSRLGPDGAQVATTAATTLINRYVFARDDKTWKLVAFSRAR